MIIVPDEIKTLFKQDSVRKNFRISFPNGEYSDLVNKDIVSESVTFTESVGSTNGLKFGLCEGATLEFDTFFNHNIRNLKIYAEIEIDISSLDQEFITEYGTTSDDVDYTYYSIPYGYFYVDSCKRNAQNNQRRVVAYQNKWDVYNTEMMKSETFETLKMRAGVSVNNPYTIDMLKYSCSNLNSVSLIPSDITPTTTVITLS